jgi:hypothetical protein
MIRSFRPIFGLCLGLLLPGSITAFAQSRTVEKKSAPSPITPAATAIPAATEFAAFRAVSDRNIFNASRVDRIARSETLSAPPPAPPPAQTITFVGTMAYDKGNYAFFDSSEAAYRRVLSVDETLGVFQITAINTDSVELRQADETVTMNLRQQLRRTADSPWTLTDAPVATANHSTPGSAAANSTDQAKPNPPSSASETLRRLMEKRRQKTQKP